MKYLLLFFMVFIFIVPCAEAKEITLSLNQSEYYFRTGENAIIVMNSENEYGKDINSMLTYTISQYVNQGGFQYSNSNTQSSSFLIPDDETNLPLNFGTSKSPADLTVSLKFSYFENENMEVILDDISIHFVSDESQKNNEENKIESSSQKQSSSQSKQSSSQQQQMQKAQQKLQNNQLSQDSSALKKQIEQQLQEEQKMKEEFQKQLSQNPEFQEQHKDLTEKGYELKNQNLNPSSVNNGSFEMEYEKKNGEKASLKGEMENGSINKMQKDTHESRQEMLDKLNQNKQFQKYKEQLEKEGFQQQTPEFDFGNLEQNKTTLNINYVKDNQTASIKTEFDENNTIKKIELIKDDDKKNYFWWFLLVPIAAYLLYKKYLKKNNITKEPEQAKVEKKLDYTKEALNMLKKAKLLFEKKQFKDAYGKASQALRLYLNYKNNISKELTNDEVIESLRKLKKPFKEQKEFFDLCSLVEFAKYKANKEDFDKIISYAEKIIK